METHGSFFLVIMKRLLFTLSVALYLPAQAVTFDAWVAGYSLTGSNATETADPDKDGMSNLMEYALDGGIPNAHGPMSLKPVFGWCMPLADGSFSQQTQLPITGSPLGWHNCLTWKMRSGIEDVTAQAQFSQPCPASNADGSLLRWLEGQALVRVVAGASGKLQAVVLLRADQTERGFMRLQITRGTGQTMPPVIGTAQPTLQLDVGAASASPRTVGTVTNSNVTDRDLVYAQTSSPTIVTDFVWPWEVGASGYTEGQVTRQSSATGVLTPTSGNKNAWTYVSAGNAVMRLITPARTYERAITTTSQSTVIARTISSTVAASMRRHLDDQVNNRISSFQSLAERAQMYSARDPGVSYTRNPNCWLTSVDLTPIAAWNSETAAYGNSWRGQTLVSPRHYIGAAHWPVSVGTTLHFVTSANAVVARTVTGIQDISGTDIRVGVLNADVPGTIDFARVLPANWATKLPTLSLFGVPVCSTDQSYTASCRLLVGLSTNVVCAPPTAANQMSFYKPAISGDSGSPCFMIVANKMVLLCAWLGGGGGLGPSITHNRTAINAAMTALGGGYQLTDVNLSAYTSY